MYAYTKKSDKKTTGTDNKKLKFESSSNDFFANIKVEYAPAEPVDLYGEKSIGAQGEVIQMIKVQRPAWHPYVTFTCVPDHSEQEEHRRHIVMSLIMRSAVERVANLAAKHNQQYDFIRLSNQLTKLSNIGEEIELVHLDMLSVLHDEFSVQDNASFVRTNDLPETFLEKAANNIAFILHNNEYNLIADRGDYNSTIGAMAHNLDCTNQDRRIEELYSLYGKDREAFIRELSKGCWKQCKANIEAALIDMFPLDERPLNSIQFRRRMYNLYDSLTTDIMTTKSLPKPIADCIIFTKRFMEVSDLSSLTNVAIDFVNLGIQNYGYPPEGWLGPPRIQYKPAAVKNKAKSYHRPFF